MFTVVHYAGRVTYSGVGMMQKNKDTVQPDLVMRGVCCCDKCALSCVLYEPCKPVIWARLPAPYSGCKHGQHAKNVLVT